MLFLAAFFCLATGAVVGLSGEEPRVKLWFVALCVSCAAVCAGLWVEVHLEAWSLLAARVNMTAAVAAGGCGLVATCVMCRLPLNRPLLFLLAAATVFNVATVWVTDMYFTGAFYRYRWGIYVAGDPKFVLNPLLSSSLVGYALLLLARNYRAVHPLDRNRAKYLLLAFAFLAASVLDYLPHFGIDLFGGSVSALGMPLFAVTFGYACVRYRLLKFRELVGRASGWLLTGLVIAAAYALFLEFDRRWFRLGTTPAHVGAALTGLLLFATAGTRLPRFIERRLGAAPVDFQPVVEKLSGELLSILDEPALRARVMDICSTHFQCERVAVLDQDAVEADAGLTGLVTDASGTALVESEVHRRREPIVSGLLAEYEVLIPLRSQEQRLGAVAVGRRSGNEMYRAGDLKSLRVLGNIFAIALVNARRAVELQRRLRLDRYLPPQVVAGLLGGRHDLIEGMRRMTVTIFFSDLQGFTSIADRLDPETLATVLNEYLSEMADIAFRYGGTLDKFIGDAVMVFFGAPVAAPPPEHAGTCVEMAIAMQRHLARLNARWREQGLVSTDLIARMGIHTGEATVGSFGSHNRLEYTAIGHAVNLASRLEGKDRPGCILVSRETWSLVKERFQATPGGAITVKGMAESIEVFEIDPASATFRSSRFDLPVETE
jgi:class 3 adenylate cyclase